MAGKRNCSLFCAPQPIARLIQVFPKLAIIFFVIHFTVMIYSFLSPSPHNMKVKEVPPGVVDLKIKPKIDAEHVQRIHSELITMLTAGDIAVLLLVIVVNKTLHAKNETALRKDKSPLLHGLLPESHHSNLRGQDHMRFQR